MDIILVPGAWLDASSWSDVTPALVAAGHHVHPLTLPGRESADANRSGIGLREHIAAVSGVLDSLERPAILVGHSAGGAIIHGVVDARPQSVVRAIYVDSGPLAEGGSVNAGIPFEGDEVPLPPWDYFEEADLVDLTSEIRDAFRARAVPEPKGIFYDTQHLGNEQRFEVPVTVITSEFPSADMIEWVKSGHPYVAELGRIRDVEYVDLPTGHWPQFTRPADLGEAILAAVDR